MSCLFIAFSHFVTDSPDKIRSRICDYLASDACLFDTVKCSDVAAWSDNTSLASYVDSMRLTSTWGGAIEIKAFCEIYHRVVHVYDHHHTLIASFIPSSGMGPLVELIWSGSHYEAIRNVAQPPTVNPSSSLSRRVRMRIAL